MKKLIAAVAALALGTSMISMPVSAVGIRLTDDVIDVKTDEEYPTSGYCGAKGSIKSLTWSFNEFTGTLTISGKGEMRDWSDYDDYAPWHGYDISEIVIEDGVLSIGNYAFIDCSLIKSVNIPETVTYIGESAFYNCSALDSIDIPDSVTNIGKSAFAYCENLTSVRLSNNITTIEGLFFLGCINLTSVAIPENVSKIEYCAFEDCTNLTSVIIPENVSKIGSGAFEGCSSLVSVTIPKNTTDIEDDVFNETPWLNEKLESSAFVLVNNVVIASNPDTCVGDITIPYGSKSVCDGAFEDCNALTSVTIPGSVTSIGEFSFSYCSNLTSIKISEGVKKIDVCAFAGCENLSSVTVPDSVDFIGGAAFEDTPWLDAQLEESPFVKAGHVVIDSNQSTCIGNITIPNDITCIAENAFSYCENLDSVIIPNSVTSIGDEAFYRCENLTSLTIPDSVTKIGESAFEDSGLDSIRIPKGVTQIESATFEGCTGLLFVDISDSVTSIGYEAFAECINLRSITIPGSVKEIGDYAFAGCIKIPDVTIPDSVTNIGEGVFDECTNLRSVSIPYSVTSIEKYAFWECTRLESITIPYSVRYIGFEAFYNCRDLSSVFINNPECEIYDSDGTFSDSGEDYNDFGGTIYGYENSTAQSYAEKYNYNFKSLGLAPEVETYTQIYFEEPITMLDVGETRQLVVHSRDVLYENGEYTYTNDRILDSSEISWNSGYYDESGIISMSDDGQVTALKEGIEYVLVHLKDDTSTGTSCRVFVGDPNEFSYSATYDTRQYYANGGFFSEVSSVSDCVEIYMLLENKMADELKNLTSVDGDPYGDEARAKFKDISPVTLTATVDGDGLSFERDRDVNTYTASFDALSVGDAVDDILTLFPNDIDIASSGNNYTVTVTLESESFDTITEQYTFTVEDLETKNVNDHIAFVTQNPGYLLFKQNTYGNTMVTLKDDADYKWSKFSSFDFKNYYQITLADIMIQMLDADQVEMPSLIPDYIKDWIGTYRTLLNGISTIVNDDYAGIFNISESLIDKLLKKSKYAEDGIYAEDELYQTVLEILGNAGNSEKIKEIFEKIDKTQQVFDLVKLGTNIFKDAVEWGNKISLYNTYANSDAKFKEIMKTFADTIPESENEMKEAVYDYVNYSSDKSGQAEEILESFSGMFGNVSLDVFKSSVGKGAVEYLGVNLLNWIGDNIILESGAALSSTVAFAGIQTAFGSIFTGASLGFCLSDALCNNSGKAEEMSKTVAMSEFSPYVIDTLKIYESRLFNERSNESVDAYEYAFALHKATQSYIMDHTVKALETERDSIIIKLFGRDDYDGLISDILSHKNIIDNLKCHNSDGESTAVTKTKVVSVKGPANISVYDGNGQKIVNINGDTPEYIGSEINCFVENGEKYIALPADQNYSVEIIATDEGSMDYAVTEYDGGAEPLKTVKITDIELFEGKDFTGNISDIIDDTPESYALQYDDNTLSPDDVTTTTTTTTTTTITTTTTTSETTTEPAQETTAETVTETVPMVTTTTENTTDVTTEVESSVTTGEQITVPAQATTEATEPALQDLGDVDRSGNIDSSDASIVLQEYALLATGHNGDLTPEQTSSADVNSDGSVDSSDASTILRYYAYTATGGKDPFDVFLKKGSHPRIGNYEIIPMMEPFQDFFFVKTDNLDPDSFRFVDKESIYTDETDTIESADTKYADVNYENEKNLRVNGGYLFRSTLGTTDGGKVSLQLYDNAKKEWEDTEMMYELPKLCDEVDYLIQNFANKPDFFENMDAVQSGFSDICLYSGSYVRGEIQRVSTYWNLQNSPHNDQSFYVVSPYSRTDNQTLLASSLYPFRYDSIGFPSILGEVALRLDNSATYKWDDYYHYEINVTYNGETHTYGGAGSGEGQGIDESDIRPFTLNDEKITFTLNEIRNLLDTYAKLDVPSDIPHEDDLTLENICNTVGENGAWVSLVGVASIFGGTYNGYAYLYKGDNDYYFSTDELSTGGCLYWGGSLDYASDAWVDSRYVNENEVFEPYEKFEDHPTSDIILTKTTYPVIDYDFDYVFDGTTGEYHKEYTSVNIVEKEGLLRFSYNADENTWEADEYAVAKELVDNGMLDENNAEALRLTYDEVMEMEIDANNDKWPSSGYIYDGSAAPGTPFQTEDVVIETTVSTVKPLDVAEILVTEKLTPVVLTDSPAYTNLFEFLKFENSTLPQISTGKERCTSVTKDRNHYICIDNEYSLLATGHNGDLTPEQTSSADVNSDGSVDSSDASTILRYYAYMATGGKDPFDVFLKS